MYYCNVDWAEEWEYRSLKEEDIMKNALIISCFNWYKPRLQTIRELLLENGYNVTVLIADFEHMTLRPVCYRYSECTYIKVPRYKRNLSLHRIWSHLTFSREVNIWIRRNNPDLIYCQVPPNKVSMCCKQYKKTHPEKKLIIDIIDLWPESMPLGKLKRTIPAKVWKSWRDKAIMVADHVFTECDLYQEELEDIIDPKKTSTLYLYKEQTEKERELIQEVVDKRYNRSQDSCSIIRFAYLGSMNNIIDIDGICSVINQFQEKGYSCELHAIGNGESKNIFEEKVKATGCITYFYGSVFDEEKKIKHLAPCDYALNMMKDEVSVGLTIKSIDYLSYGLPLINNIKGDTWKMVEEENVGINVSRDGIDTSPKDHSAVIDLFANRFSKEAFSLSVKKGLEQVI